MNKPITKENFFKFLDSQEDILSRGRLVELDSFYRFLTGHEMWKRGDSWVPTIGYKRWIEPIYDTVREQLMTWAREYANARGMKAYFGSPSAMGIGFLRMEKKSK